MFNEEKAEEIIEYLERNEISQIDAGDFELNGVIQGQVKEFPILNSSKVPNNNQCIHILPTQAEQANQTKQPDEEKNPSKSIDEKTTEEAEQIARITSLIKKVDDIDFTDKTFVFDRLDYVPINGEYHGPDSPEHNRHNPWSDLMEAIYKEGEEIKISFNDSVNEVTMVYEYMPVECGISAGNWRSHQEYMPEDIDEIDRQKEAKASKSMQEKLNYAQTAYEKTRKKLEEAESEPDRNSRELAELEKELEESLTNYDADRIKIKDDSNTAVEELQRQLAETVDRKEKKMKERRELETALDKTFALAISKKNKYREEISATRSVIRQLESDEEELEDRIRKTKVRKEMKLVDLDTKISDLRSRIAKIKKQSESSPDRIAALKEELADKKEDLFKAQQEADNFHIDYLINEHGEIIEDLARQITNKQKRIEKLKGEIAKFEGELGKEAMN